MQTLPDIKWTVPNMSEISRVVCIDMRLHFIDLKNKIRRIDLMKAAANKKKKTADDYERIRYLNADRALVMMEVRELVKDYRYAWNRAVA